MMFKTNLKQDRLSKAADLVPHLPFKKSTLHKWSKDGRFPKSITVGNGRTKYWRNNDVIEWFRNPQKWMDANKAEVLENAD